MFRFSLIVSFIAVGTLARAQQPVFTPQDLFRIKRVAEVATSPDASHIAYTVNIERPFADGKGSDFRELYVFNVQTGEHVPYILGNNFISEVQWKPDSKQITFMGKMSDAKTATLYGINLSGGTWFQIADLPGASAHSWRPDGKAIAYLANEPAESDPREERQAKMYERMGFDAAVFEENVVNKAVFVYDLETQTSKQWSKSGCVFGYEWSPKGDRIAAQIAPRNLVDDSYMFKDIFILNDLGQQMLVDVPGKLGEMEWSPDGKYLAFLAAVDVHDPANGSLFIVNTDQPTAWTGIKNYTHEFKGTVSHVTWKDNSTVLFFSDESVDQTLREVKVTGGESTLVIAGGQCTFSSPSLSGNVLAFSGNTWQHPDELYTFDLKQKSLKRQTRLNPWLDSIALGKQEKFTWKAKDGTELEGYLIYPVNYQPGTSYPLITYVHGGPEACVINAWSTYYSTWGQIAAGRDMFVFAPNYRSSTGRGVAFSKYGQKDLADEEFTDILDGIDKLIADGKVNRYRVGIGGGSYGGYLSAWAATKYSDRFAASVCFVGVTNQISKRNTTDIPYEDYYVHWLIWNDEDINLIYDRSPVKWASNNKTPTLILGGEADTRVHPSQSLELYRTLKLNGKAAVRYVTYPGEGHGNRNNPAQLDYAMRTLEWFTFYLKEGRSPTELPPAELDYGVELRNGDRPDRPEREGRSDGSRPEREGGNRQQDQVRPGGNPGAQPQQQQQSQPQQQPQQQQEQKKPGG